MKKIFLSLSMIVVVGVAIAGATGAFYGDTETSTGNTFTAGAIDLKVDSTSHYNGMICTLTPDSNPLAYTWQPENGEPVSPEHFPSTGSPCDGTWAETDLDGVKKFFNFLDLKPGDEGEDTISLHVYNNDAWGQLVLSGIVDKDNDCTEPEQDEENGACSDPDGNGEIDDYLAFDGWLDQGSTPGFQNGDNTPQDDDLTEGDNIYQEYEGPKFWDNETINDIGPFELSEVLGAAYQIKGCTDPDGNTGYLGCHGLAQDGRMVESTTYYFGLAWSLPLNETLNDAQTDSYSADMTFYVEQHRNNPNPFGAVPPVGPTVGANLSAYVQPACDVNVTDVSGDGEIQTAINAASAGQTICVGPGTYTEDVNVNKDITLSGDGASNTSTINGVGTGEAGALVISADGATVEGFNVIGTGVSAIRISGARDNVTVRYNHATAATGKNAFLTDGGQSNHTISNNVFDGSASQLVYVNGLVSVANPSTNVDFTSNTFGGTATGPLLGNEANSSSVTLSKFSGTTGYTSLESFEGDLLVNQNNFNVVGQTHVTNGGVGTLNAENNWWGDITPADNVTGSVDFTPSEVSAFTQN